MLNEIKKYEIKVITDSSFVRPLEVWKSLGSIEKLKKFSPDIEEYSINMNEKLRIMLDYYSHNLVGIKDENIDNC
jgi:hypothetical protein